MKGKNKQFAIFIHSSFDVKKRETVFNDIWKEYYPKITVYINTTYPGTDAEDIVQEILLKVYNNLHCYNPLYSFNTWIYTIARNCAVDSFRKNLSISRIFEAVKNDGEANLSYDNESPEKILIKSEDQAELAKCIENLTERERQISFLKFYEDLTYREISRILEIPVGTLKYIVSKIKREVEACYQKQNGGQYGN